MSFCSVVRAVVFLVATDGGSCRKSLDTEQPVKEQRNWNLQQELRKDAKYHTLKIQDRTNEIIREAL